jgi:Mrp family chromosome partitioning ATPase
MISLIQDPAADVMDRRFEQVLAHLEAARQRAGRARVIAIAGCTSGDGATFVLNELARRLAERAHRGVLKADCADLVLASHLKPGELLAQCSFSRDAGLWLLSSPGRDAESRFSERSGEADVVSAMAALSARFDFVFMDCGALNIGGGIWQVADVVDDVFLVVAAGETRRDQVAHAQRVIAQSGAHLTGCILNKRTYPLPGAIHRLLN